MTDQEPIPVIKSKETFYSSSYDESLYSSPSEPWVRPALAMIIGRLVYAGSKLSLTRVSKDSALWELCGIEGEVNSADTMATTWKSTLMNPWIGYFTEVLCFRRGRKPFKRN